MSPDTYPCYWLVVDLIDIFNLSGTVSFLCAFLSTILLIITRVYFRIRIKVCSPGSWKGEAKIDKWASYSRNVLLFSVAYFAVYLALFVTLGMNH